LKVFNEYQDGQVIHFSGGTRATRARFKYPSETLVEYWIYSSIGVPYYFIGSSGCWVKEGWVTGNDGLTKAMS